MANGYRCEKCGYQEADHVVAGNNLLNPYGIPLKITKEEKRKIKENIQLEFPGICNKYRNRDPKSHLDYEDENEENYNND